MHILLMKRWKNIYIYICTEEEGEEGGKGEG